MKIKISLLALLYLTIATQAQNKIALQYAEQLDTTRIRSTLTILTSAEYLGRKSSENGARLAADYLSKQLTINGLKPGNNGSFYQNIEAVTKAKSNKYFKLAGYNYDDCYSYSNNEWQDSVINATDIVFAGFGIYHSTYNDFATTNINGKIVMVLEGDGPINKYGVRCHKADEVPSLKYINEQKPKAIVKIKRDFNTFSSYTSERISFYSSTGSPSIPLLYINELLANKVLEPINKTVKQLIYESECNCSTTTYEFKNDFAFNGDYKISTADVNNVVAIIEGTDLKDEYIVLSAHYDHIGKSYGNKYYPGADDNASGVSAVLEIARILNQAKKANKGPRRSIIILFPTAEEDGLIGSSYYTQKPIFPLEKTIACINIDMIGRTATEIEQAVSEQGYVYALTGRKEFNEAFWAITDSINKKTANLVLFGNDNSSNYDVFSRSDHYSFYNKKIPSMMFTNGAHADLHESTDSLDKIQFNELQKRAKLVFLTLWELANNPKPLKSKQLNTQSPN